jgi:hypothetical protein
MFMVMSALTASGLNTVNLSQLTTFQQAELLVLMMIGNQVLISYFTVAFRKHIFEKRFEDIVEIEREKRRKTSNISSVVGMTGTMFGLPVMSSFGKGQPQRNSRVVKHLNNPGSPVAVHVSPDETPNETPDPDVQTTNGMARVGNERIQAQHVGFLEPIREQTSFEEMPLSATTGHSIYATHSHQSGATRRRPQTTESKSLPGFNVQTFVKEQKRNIGRNGQFFNLDSDQREYLGGVEYRSLKFLSVFVILYFLLLAPGCLFSRKRLAPLTNRIRGGREFSSLFQHTATLASPFWMQASYLSSLLTSYSRLSPSCRWQVRQPSLFLFDSQSGQCLPY